MVVIVAGVILGSMKLYSPVDIAAGIHRSVMPNRKMTQAEKKLMRRNLKAARKNPDDKYGNLLVDMWEAIHDANPHNEDYQIPCVCSIDIS